MAMFGEKYHLRNAQMTFLQASKVLSLMDEGKYPSNFRTTLFQASDGEIITNEDLRNVLTLAESARKYCELIEMILDDIKFYSAYSQYLSEQNLVKAILCYYLLRDWIIRKRFPDEAVNDICHDVERTVLDFQVKLAAAVARRRIKNRYLSLKGFLSPTYVKEEEKSASMTIFAWINTLLTSIDEVEEMLKDLKFIIRHEKDVDGNLAANDVLRHSLLQNVYIFQRHHQHILWDSKLIASLHLVQQPLSSIMAAHSLARNYHYEEQIVIMNTTTPLTAVNVECLTAEKKSLIRLHMPVKCRQEQEAIRKVLKASNSKCIRLFFSSVQTVGIDSLKGFHHALVQAKCTRSGVINPVDFTMNEMDDVNVIANYVRRMSVGARPDKMERMVNVSYESLRLVMAIPKMRSIIFVTNSIYTEENGLVVTRAVDMMRKYLVHQRTDPFVVCPPVLQLSPKEIKDNYFLNGKYIEAQSSNRADGFFMAILVREAVQHRGR